jgi:threonine/homoserine/homoserine lactone efflux protein
MQTMATTICNLPSSQGPKIISMFCLVIVIVAIVDVILVGVIFVVLADYFRFVVKDQGFFGKLFMMMAGILLLLALLGLDSHIWSLSGTYKED